MPFIFMVPTSNLYPHAADIYEHVKDLDPRIGMCLDIGHDARAGHDPIADLKKVQRQSVRYPYEEYNRSN
jgi:hypothetical protein